MIHQMQQQSVNPFTKTTLVERCLVITITAATAVVAAITALQATLHPLSPSDASLHASSHPLNGKMALLFSYGSGLASSILAFRFRLPQQLHSIATALDLPNRLANRKQTHPSILQADLQQRQLAFSSHSYEPKGSLNDLLPGTFYLSRIDEKYRRHYEMIPMERAEERKHEDEGMRIEEGMTEEVKADSQLMYEELKTKDGM